MMNSKNKVLEVCNILRAALPNVTVISEFPDQLQDLPLRKPVISVGVNAVAVESGNDSKHISGGNSPAAVTIRMSVCVPKTDTGIKCTEIVDTIVNSMGTFLSRTTIIDIKVSDIRYSATLSALNVNVDVKFNMGNVF